MESLEYQQQTMENVSMDDSQVDLNPSDGPGQTLRSAREQLKFSVAQVAEKMHLSPRIVQALEADQYNTIANFTFVRGYLRTYARLLNLSGDDVVQTFNRLQLTEKTSDCARVQFSQRHTPVAKDRRLLYLITGLIVLLLLILMVIWRQHQSQISKKPSLFSQQLQHVPVKTVSQTVAITEPINVATNQQQVATKPVVKAKPPENKNTTQPKPVKLVTPFAS